MMHEHVCCSTRPPLTCMQVSEVLYEHLLAWAMIMSAAEALVASKACTRCEQNMMVWLLGQASYMHRDYAL